MTTFQKRIDASPLKRVVQTAMERGSSAITVHNRIGTGKLVTPTLLKQAGIRTKKK
jgi:hypothetical protein